MEAQAHRSGGTGASLWRHRRLALEAQAPCLCLLRMLIRHVRGRPLTRSARASILASNMLIPHVPTYLELKINV